VNILVVGVQWVRLLLLLLLFARRQPSLWIRHACHYKLNEIL
jgi:hypothetical protein